MSPRGLPDSPLPRSIGLGTAALAVIGIVVGSGIFRVPAVVAGLLGAPGPILAVWVTGGLLTLCVALLFAELGSEMPRVGGTYVYLRAAFGDRIGFVFGWTFLLVNPASWATLAISCIEFLAQLVPIGDAARRGAAAALIAAFVIANCRSVRLGARLQNVATVAKLVALLAGVIVVAFVAGPTAAAGRGNHPPDGALLATQAGGLSAWLSALVAVLWAYDGAAGLCSLAGEVRAPARNLPRALFIGVGTVMVVYALVNVALLHALPVESIAASPLPLATAIEPRLGTPGSGCVALAVVVATAGSLAGSVLADPRIFMAMARDGNFFPAVGRVARARETPVNAIVLHGLLACVYVSARTFEQLAATFVLGLVPFYALAAVGAWRLRRRVPAAAGGFRAPALPVLMTVWIVAAILLVGNACFEMPGVVAVNLLVTGAGFPVYVAWRRLRNSAPELHQKPAS